MGQPVSVNDVTNHHFLTIIRVKDKEDPKNDGRARVPNKGSRQGKEVATIKSLWGRQSMRKHLLMYWIYSFLIITVDETFPLYYISKHSGLGVEEKMIGNLLSGAGSFYILIQFFLLTSLVNQYGFYRSMRTGAFFGVPVVCLIPLSLMTNHGAAEGTLAWSTLALVR